MPTSHLRSVVTIIVALCAMQTAVLGAASGAHAAREPAVPRALAAAPTPTPQPAPTPAPAPAPAPPAPPSRAPAAPSPSPAPAPSPAPSAPDSDSGECGLFDVTCRVNKAINGWFKSLVTSAINPVFDMVGTSLLSTPRLNQMPRVSGLWSTSVAIANTVFVLFVLAGGLILMGHQSVQTSYAVKDIAPRLVIGIVAANISLLVVGQAIDLANGLSTALVGGGVNADQAAGQLKKTVLHAINPADVGIFIVLVVVGAVVLGLILTLIYIVRIMLTILLIAAAPLFLMCHALPQTEGLAKLWWRALAGVLAIQVAQALVFITAMRVLFTTDLSTWFGVRTPGDQIDLWIALCLLYILVRIPSWISRMVWQGGLSRSPLVRAAKTAAMLVIFRGLLPKTAGHAAGRGGRPAPAAARPAPSATAALPPSSAAPQTQQPEPRWGPAEQQWMPPDPAWHQQVHHGRPAPDSTTAQQRWGNPDTTWTPPHAGDWRALPPAPRRSPPRQPASPPPPEASRPWKPPA
jgi:hypothetical protein